MGLKKRASEKQFWSFWRFLFFMRFLHSKKPKYILICLSFLRFFTYVWWLLVIFGYKIALNRLLALPAYRSRREILESSGIIDFENKNISVVTKHWNYRISVPILYIAFVKSINWKIDYFINWSINFVLSRKAQSISSLVEQFN